ncbi:MAG TPA: phosphoglycerate kinase [Acidimicrobiales bacterium]|nr:phosphoglycerate kinase [Acidimicrobiales bacterium]
MTAETTTAETTTGPLAGIPLLEDLLPLHGRRVLVRTDFNVPLTDGPDGTTVVEDDFRIRAALPTLEWLRAQGASVTACSHLGRPKGKVDPRYDVAPVRARLRELCPGVELLENLRFDPGEESDDPDFVRKLVAGFDAYVNDAFGSSHRAHASIVGPPAVLPSAAGRLLAREVRMLGTLLTGPPQPFVAVVGGAKVADKLGVLRALLEIVDRLVIGGGMAFTFLSAAGHPIGRSLFDADDVDACRDLLERAGDRLVLPTDLVALSPDGELGRGGAGTGQAKVTGLDLPEGWEGADIGPDSRRRFAAVLGDCGSVFWNGPMGAFEDPRFADGTRAVADAIAASSSFSVVGGGDTVAALDGFGLSDRVTFVSTGGGASLELLEQGDLPGLEALRDTAQRERG